MKKLKKWQIVLAVIVVIGVVGAIAGSGKGEEAKPDPGTGETEKKEEAKQFHIGDTVMVEDVEYTVLSRETMKTIGTGIVSTEAKDMFLVIELTLKNNGKDPLTVSDSLFKLILGDKTYSADSASSLYLDKSGILYEEINPDSSLAGKIIFDISQDTIDNPELQLQVQTSSWGKEKALIQLN